MLRAVLFPCLLALLALAPRHGRAQTPLAPDQRIRAVVTEGDFQYRTAGTVLEIGRDSLLLLVKGMQRSVPLAALSRIEIGRGSGNRPKWAAVGALAGTAVGYVYSLYDRNNTRETELVPTFCQPDGECLYERRRVPYPGSRTVAFTLSGSAVGALVGFLAPGDRWQPLSASAGPAPAAASPSRDF